MRTIIVDDEPWMLKRFAIECEGIPDVQLLGSFKSPVKALEFAKENPVELALLIDRRGGALILMDGKKA